MCTNFDVKSGLRLIIKLEILTFFQHVGVVWCPIIWMIVGQGPIALAVGAGGVVWTF